MYDSLRDEIKRLQAEITITERKLGAAGEETCKQHDSFLRGMLPTNQQLHKNKEIQSEPIFEALTRVELAAQLLVAVNKDDLDDMRQPAVPSRSGINAYGRARYLIRQRFARGREVA
jgi:hypothetical protein